MIRLTDSLYAWGTPDFAETVKKEIEQLNTEQLPLQQGLSTGSYVSDAKHKVMIIRITDVPDFIRVKAGIFYSGIIAGCSCADDPTPIDENSEYCEVQLDIHKETADTSVTLLAG